jgi:hypothetical protein
MSSYFSNYYLRIRKIEVVLMLNKGLIQFDDDGRLYINHECKVCSMFPLENLNEPCLSCGISQQELIVLKKNVNRANKALDLFAKFLGEDENDIDVREAFLHLSSISLGEGFDQVVFTDIDQTDEIRGLADLAEHMCRVVIYPTKIRHIEGDDYYEDEDWDEED